MADGRDLPGNPDTTGEADAPAPSDGSSASPLPYASPPVAVNFKTLRRMPSFEANLAAAKLEAAGVHAFVADENISVAHPLAFSQVPLQVAEADLERAEQILAAPSPATDPEHGEADGDNGDEGGEYVDEPYRCPRCHRKAVDLLPLSGGLQWTRLGCLGVLLLPLAAGVIAWAMPAAGPRGGYPPSVVLGWAAFVGVLSFIVLTAQRTKRCRDCGHEWANLGDA